MKQNILPATLLSLFVTACADENGFYYKSKQSQLLQDQTVVAKEVFIIRDAFGPGLFAASLNAEKSILPPGGIFSGNQLSWRTDLQDIDKTFSGVLIPSEADKLASSAYGIRVVAPPVEKVSCGKTPEPVIGSVSPEMKWHWKGWKNYLLTFSAPVAGDITGDGDVEIVTMISTRSYGSVNGPIVVLKGATGEVLWNSLEESGFGAEVSTTPVLLDLDNDGKSEIITVSMDGSSRKIDIIDFQQRSVRSSYRENFSCGAYCIPAAADLDGDGKAEIVAGNVILNHEGKLKHYLTPAPIHHRFNTTTLAELVPDYQSPGLEVIVNGSQVYSSTGQLLWRGECLGFSAVADLDNDGLNELVCTGQGHVYVYSHNGVVLWKRAIPGGGNGGAPNLGRFTAGAELQIGVAGGEKYVVYTKDGNLLWDQTIQDKSSSSTGSTIFDLNGDGLVEVIYNDETHLRIFDGATGSPLWSEPNISGTLWEYPIIVDIDNDGSADIVVAAPGWHTDNVPSPGQGGIKVFTDPAKKWVSTRKVWNQYSYYPKIVADDLKVTSTDVLPKTGFRINLQGTPKKEGRLLLPDLGIIAPFFPDEGGDRLSVYVMNHGEAPSLSDKNLRIINRRTGKVVGVAKDTDPLLSGQGRLVSIPVDSSELENGRDLQLEINLNGSIGLTSEECNDKNNKVNFDLLDLKR